MSERTKVVVVDDNPGNRYAVARVLRVDGYQVLEGESAADALRLTRAEQPELLVLDIKLPDMLGFEVNQILREDPATRHVSILNVSASYTNAESQALGLGQGADGYLVHPIDPQVLRATVHALLRLRASERRLADLLVKEQEARAERERLFSALEQSEARFKRLWDAGLLGILYWNIDGRVTDANDAFLRMLGYTREDLAAGRIDFCAASALCSQSGHPHAAQLEAIRTRGVTDPFESTLRRKDGSEVELLIGAAAFTHEPGSGVTFALDISDRKRYERERSKLLRELEEALRSRDEFLAIASHDLKGPLAAMSLKLDVLLRAAEKSGEALSPDFVVPKLSGLRKQVDDLVRLLEDLLDISRIASGKLTIRREEMDLAATTRGAMERLAEQAKRVGSALTFTSEGPVVGCWDPLRVDQVVTNLLTNALRYGAGRPIHVGLTATAASARLSVRDQGVGISPENLQRIFQRFERVESGRGAKSYGLGLWIVQRIVQAMGGTISVVSELGKGSTFTVDLPRNAP